MTFPRDAVNQGLERLVAHPIYANRLRGATPGAYVLILKITVPISVTINSLAHTILPAGSYAYAGSAKGPGGIRARVARHLRKDKKPHWHIDRITTLADIIDVQTYPDGDECDLVAGLMAQPGAHHPIKGFGSTDCRNCGSHLVKLS